MSFFHIQNNYYYNNKKFSVFQNNIKATCIAFSLPSLASSLFLFDIYIYIYICIFWLEQGVYILHGNMSVSERADAILFIYQIGYNQQQYYMNSMKIGCCLVEAALPFSFILFQREKRWGLRKTKGEVNTVITTTTTTRTIITSLVHTKNSFTSVKWSFTAQHKRQNRIWIGDVDHAVCLSV